MESETAYQWHWPTNVSGVELIRQLSFQKLKYEAQSDDSLFRGALVGKRSSDAVTGKRSSDAIMGKRGSDAEKKRNRGPLVRQMTTESAGSRRHLLSEMRQHRHWRSCEVDHPENERHYHHKCLQADSDLTKSCSHSRGHSECEIAVHGSSSHSNSQRPSYLDLSSSTSLQVRTEDTFTDLSAINLDLETTDGVPVKKMSSRSHSSMPVRYSKKERPINELSESVVITVTHRARSVPSESGLRTKLGIKRNFPSCGARNIVVLISLFLLLMCILLVGVTLRLAPFIDEIGESCDIANNIPPPR